MTETFALALHVPKKHHVALIGQVVHFLFSFTNYGLSFAAGRVCGQKVKHVAMLLLHGCVRLTSDFKVRVQIPDRTSSSSVVMVTGAKADTERCKEEIQKILKFKVSSEPLGVYEIRVEPRKHGAIIGKGGSTLRQIEADSGCGLTVPPVDSGDECVLIEGSKGPTLLLLLLLCYSPVCAEGANIAFEAIKNVLGLEVCAITITQHHNTTMQTISLFADTLWL